MSLQNQFRFSEIIEQLIKEKYTYVIFWTTYNSNALIEFQIEAIKFSV